VSTEVEQLRAEVTALTAQVDGEQGNVGRLEWLLGQVEAERDEARAERVDMDAYAQRLRGAVLDLKAERDSLAAQLAEAIQVIDRVHAAEKAFLSRAVDAEHALTRARPVLEAAGRSVEQILQMTGGRTDSPWITADGQSLIAAWQAYQSSPSEPADA